MLKLCAHSGNLDLISSKLKDELSSMPSGSRLCVEVKKWVDKRTLSMNSLQHCIYAEVSRYLILKGRLEWSPEFVKKNLKNKFLGWETEVFVDVVTGERCEVQSLKKTSGLDKGDSYLYTEQIIDWAASIGCEVKIPEKSEFMSLQLHQNT